MIIHNISNPLDRRSLRVIKIRLWIPDLTDLLEIHLCPKRNPPCRPNAKQCIVPGYISNYIGLHMVKCQLQVKKDGSARIEIQRSHLAKKEREHMETIKRRWTRCFGRTPSSFEDLAQLIANFN